MAYEDTKCPCGLKKLTDTMLCDDCNSHFSTRREMNDYQDPKLPLLARRNAAVILVTLARGRLRANNQRSDPAPMTSHEH